MLSKLILEKYLNNRFIAGEAKGRQEANEEWRAWYNRMIDAREQGQEFEEPPPESPGRNG